MWKIISSSGQFSLFWNGRRYVKAEEGFDAYFADYFKAVGNEYERDLEYPEAVPLMENLSNENNISLGIVWTGSALLLSTRKEDKVWMQSSLRGLHMAIVTALQLPESNSALTTQEIAFLGYVGKKFHESLFANESLYTLGRESIYPLKWRISLTGLNVVLSMLRGVGLPTPPELMALRAPVVEA